MQGHLLFCYCLYSKTLEDAFVLRSVSKQDAFVYFSAQQGLFNTDELNGAAESFKCQRAFSYCWEIFFVKVVIVLQIVISSAICQLSIALV